MVIAFSKNCLESASCDAHMPDLPCLALHAPSKIHVGVSHLKCPSPNSLTPVSQQAMSDQQHSEGQKRPQGPTCEEPAQLEGPHDPTSQANVQMSESTAILDDSNVRTSDHPPDAHLMSGALLPQDSSKPLQQKPPETDETPSAPSTPPEGTWSRELYDELRKVQEEQADDESNDLAISTSSHGQEGSSFEEEQGWEERGSGESSSRDPEQDDDDDLMFEIEP